MTPWLGQAGLEGLPPNRSPPGVSNRVPLRALQNPRIFLLRARPNFPIRLLMYVREAPRYLYSAPSADPAL